MVFDILYLDGRKLLDVPYTQRRERLEGLGLDGPNWQTPSYHRGDGKGLLDLTRQRELEGLVAKRLDSRYLPGRRTRAWLKVKNLMGQELVIGGWLPGEGKREDTIGALLVGSHTPEGQFRYGGRVGSGFTQKALRDLEERLAPLKRRTSPFEGAPKPPRGAVFVEPELGCEVEYTEWTNEGLLRHPAYKGLRSAATDEAGEVTLGPLRKLKDNAFEATVDGRKLRLSNLDKVLYPKPGFTKGQVIDYYARIGPVLLPHLHGRPLTLKRYPNGVEGEYFYEKQCPSHRPDWVETAAVYSRRNKANIDFCLANDLPTLVWAANLADLELHTSLSMAADIERPTMMVFDLDPGAPADIVDCCRVGLWVRDLFEGLGLESFPKTSGSKGLQVYVPLNVETSYEETKPFSRAVAELLEKQHPDVVVSRMTKSLRPGKVLVDWSQNDEHKTTVNVYSLRAKERPTVSTPVSWDEVDACLRTKRADVLTFDSDQVLARAEELGDLFAPVLTLKQELPSF
jgi:bifunctional non-homologous end joining protein LigD